MRSPTRRAISIACVRTIAARSWSPWKSSARARPAEQVDPQLRVALAERHRGLLEQLDGALVGHPGAPAGLLVTGRRPREQLAVADLAGDLGGRPERVEGVERLAGAVAGRAELQEDLRAARGSSMRSSSAVCSRATASSNASASIAALAARTL